ncbi:MAG: ABC transporter permease [Pseudomonadota bacterium]|nr:ABC transporter permease [Pseudomonadota bacterium]
MWRNYLTVGFRSLVKNKTYAFINIFGLALGLAACLLILLYVRYELSYDKWIPNSENIYQVQTDYIHGVAGEDLHLQMAAYVAKDALKEDFPQVDKTVYLTRGAPAVVHQGQAFAVNGFMADGLLFDVLPFELVEGDSATALRDPLSVVLSEKQAKRFFGDANPVGQSLTLLVGGEKVDHRVTAVMKDLPKNSHIRMEMVVRFDPTSYFAEAPDFLTSWGNQAGWIYATLKPGTDVRQIQAQIPAWERRNIPPAEGQPLADQQDYLLVNVADVHLGAGQDASNTPGNDRTTIVTFAIIALLVLAMACVNFTNLATARASQRAREVALRKVLGATRKQLIAQFLGESFLVVALAMLVAVAAVELLLPVYADFLEADLSLTYLGEGGLLVPILALVVIVGAAGGLYPALYLSRFRPAQILKANQSSSDAQGSGVLRNTLVVAQFAVSIGLIICTAIVYAQSVHVRESDPGFKRDGLIQVDSIGAIEEGGPTNALIQQVSRIDGVTSVGRTSIGINTGSNSTAQITVPGQEQTVELGSYIVDAHFFPTMGMAPVAGRLFDDNRPADDSSRPYPRIPEVDRALAARGLNIVVNELGAERLGFDDPANAIGKQVRSEIFDDQTDNFGLLPLTIIGVVPNARFRTAHEAVQPTMFRFSRRAHSWMLVRYAAADPTAVLKGIENVWKGIAPDVPFEAEFSEDIIAELYAAEEARAQTFAAFALLAVIIACLGLFGLAAFTAQRRTKEIGVRKVFGASTRDIVQLLAWQFSKPVIVANLIAWPIAWWVMRDWLNGFDSRIDLGPGPFILAGGLALAIALGTIAGHALKVSRANPIHALRYE